MKKLARWIRLIPFLLLLLPGTGLGAERKMTVMVYMCGSNLESLYGSASADLQEMTEAGVYGEAVSLLVMTGGSARWDSGYDPEETVILEISRRGRRIISRKGKRPYLRRSKRKGRPPGPAK